MASDYISREAAFESLERIKSYLHQPHPEYSTMMFWEVEDFIDTLPAADVRPVVLCRDCRWWTKQEKSLQGRCELAGFYPTGEWFYANGERSNCGADMREVTDNGN